MSKEGRDEEKKKKNKPAIKHNDDKWSQPTYSRVPSFEDGAWGLPELWLGSDQCLWRCRVLVFSHPLRLRERGRDARPEKVDI
jgi:hypothetical protein